MLQIHQPTTIYFGQAIHFRQVAEIETATCNHKSKLCVFGCKLRQPKLQIWCKLSLFDKLPKCLYLDITCNNKKKHNCMEIANSLRLFHLIHYQKKVLMWKLVGDLHAVVFFLFLQVVPLTGGVCTEYASDTK